MDFDFDKPPSATTLLLIGLSAFLLLCVSCMCTVPIAGLFLHKRR